MDKKQRAQAAKRSAAQRGWRPEAQVELGKTPGGPKFKRGNQYMRYMDQGIVFPDNIFRMWQYRDGKLIAKRKAYNIFTNEGINKLLNTHYDAATQITAWYLLLIDNAGISALDVTDTYDDINQVGNGWIEFTDYTDANNADSAVTRPVWSPDPASGQSITNTTVKAIYDITGTGTVHGAALVGGGAASDDKGDHAADGFLNSEAPFVGGNVGVLSGDQLKVTYTINGANP
jgi:hypothetical protein